MRVYARRFSIVNAEMDFCLDYYLVTWIRLKRIQVRLCSAVPPNRVLNVRAQNSTTQSILTPTP